MLLPCGFASYREAFAAGTLIYRVLRDVISQHGLVTIVGDEGGFAPALSSERAALTLLSEATERAGYRPGEQVFFGLDCAASEFYRNGRYELRGEGLSLDGAGLAQWYSELTRQFPIVSIEDPFAEDDWDSTQAFTAAHGTRIQIVGDDLLVTNVERLRRAIAESTCNSILVKLNQIGTLSEARQAIGLARENGLSAVVSHRSGDTEDSFISHFVVSEGTGQIKSGAPCRSERVAKYNELLRIEEELGDRARFAGRSILRAG
jgi:enolase